MPALDALLEKNIRFIDYEKIRDKNLNRLVAFGKFAGIAGTIDLLSNVGKLLLTRGYSTPFLNICKKLRIKLFIVKSNDLFLHECSDGDAAAPDDRDGY
jgi:hypothetical protein